VLGAVAELERSLIVERTLADYGMPCAKGRKIGPPADYRGRRADWVPAPPGTLHPRSL
jgi:hypothetical protein